MEVPAITSTGMWFFFEPLQSADFGQAERTAAAKRKPDARPCKRPGRRGRAGASGETALPVPAAECSSEPRSVFRVAGLVGERCGGAGIAAGSLGSGQALRGAVGRAVRVLSGRWVGLHQNAGEKQEDGRARGDGAREIRKTHCYRVANRGALVEVRGSLPCPRTPALQAKRRSFDSIWRKGAPNSVAAAPRRLLGSGLSGRSAEERITLAGGRGGYAGEIAAGDQRAGG